MHYLIYYLGTHTDYLRSEVIRANNIDMLTV